MYSEDLGANWDVVASSVHPPGYSRYLPNDYDWLAVTVQPVHVCMLVFVLGVNLV